MNSPTATPTTRGRLDVSGVSVSYGGLKALDALSLTVEPGTITGVIGPNGSGKSTLINVIGGATPAGGGSVTLDGAELLGRTIPERAEAGVARTFQSIRLFDSMTVIENVMLGATRNHRTGLLSSALHTRAARREEREQREKAVAVIATFGERLLPRLDHPVGTLSYANRRRTEISRALMLDPALLLLDEPMAGMNPHESWELAGQLPGLLASRNCSGLLVEHKMDIIISLCPTVYVLDHGVLLAQGQPRDVARIPAVEEAFLGVQ